LIPLRIFAERKTISNCLSSPSRSLPKQIRKKHKKTQKFLTSNNPNMILMGGKKTTKYEEMKYKNNPKPNKEKKKHNFSPKKKPSICWDRSLPTPSSPPPCLRSSLSVTTLRGKKKKKKKKKEKRKKAQKQFSHQCSYCSVVETSE
jgi:hypothetical protein